MPGTSGDSFGSIIYADNVDFSGNVQQSSQILLDGQLLIGSTVAPHIRPGFLTAGTGISIVNSAGGVQIASTAAPATDLHVSNFIVDASGATVGANYTTIQAAITAASSGETVVIQPGTYTENLTLKSGVSLAAFASSFSTTAPVIILGNATLTTGSCNIDNITLKTNAAACLTVSGTASVNLLRCQIISTNSVGISCDSGTVNLYQCNASDNAGTANFFTCINSSSITMVGSSFIGTGSTANTFANGSGLTLRNSVLQTAITTSDTATFNCFNSTLLSGNRTLTINGTGVNLIYNSSVSGGTSSAISIGAGALLTASNCVISSSNTNAITGAGSITYSGLSFSSSSSTINTTTQLDSAFGPNLMFPTGGAIRTSKSAGNTALLQAYDVDGAAYTTFATLTANNTPTFDLAAGTTIAGNTIGSAASGASLVLVQSQTASSSATISFISLTAYSVYFLTITGAGPTTATQALQMLVSQDNGSNYLTSGYANGINSAAYNLSLLTNLNSTTFIPISDTVSTNIINSQFYIYNTNAGSNLTILGFTNWGPTGMFLGSAPTGINAIRFKFPSGNISAGVFTLYGLKTS